MKRSVGMSVTGFLVGICLSLTAGCTREAIPPKGEPTPTKAEAPAAPTAQTAVPTKAEAPATPKAEPRAAAQPFAWRFDGTGTFPDAVPIPQWDSDEGTGILWQTRVGRSFSSPVIVQGKVFVTAEQDQLVCVDAKGGKILWEKDNGFGSLPAEMKVEERRYPSSCGFSTPTPVTDGKSVWASYGSGIVVAFDLDGNRRWIRYFDYPPATEYGRVASPVLAAGKLLVSIGHLIALDPATGQTLWEAKDARPGYGTPAPAKIADVDVVVTPLGDCLRVSDGALIARALACTTYNSPVIHGNVVYFADVTTVAFQLPEKPGDVIECRKLWEADLEGEFFSSPVYHDGTLYVASNQGLLSALDAKTGKILWQKRLEIPSAAATGGMEPANIYPSLAVAGGKLFLSNDTGTSLVLEPGAEYKQVSQNYLSEGSGASPAFAGKLLYLRGGEDLYCIGK